MVLARMPITHLPISKRRASSAYNTFAYQYNCQLFNCQSYRHICQSTTNAYQTFAYHQFLFCVHTLYNIVLYRTGFTRTGPKAQLQKASSWCCWLELIQKDRGFKWMPLSTSCHSLFFSPASKAKLLCCLFVCVFVQLHCISWLPLCLQIGNFILEAKAAAAKGGNFYSFFLTFGKKTHVAACCQAQPKRKQSAGFSPEIVSYMLRSGKQRIGFLTALGKIPTIGREGSRISVLKYQF